MSTATKDTVNGLPVLRATAFYTGPGLRPARIILVERDADEVERYITAFHCAGDKGWVWGHYFREKVDALDDFRERADQHRLRHRMATEAEIEQSIHGQR